MRRFARVLVPLLCATPTMLAQTGSVVAGMGAVGVFPVGSLHDRFLSTVGGMAYAGKRVSPTWTWIGKFEYFELNDVNAEALSITVKLQEGGGEQVYQVPLPGLSMRLQAAGLSAEALVELAEWTPVRINVRGGFGFTRWISTRGAYYDTLFVVSTVTGQRTEAAVIAVPENRQSDWSGTLNLGVDVRVRIADPVWLSVGGDYKLIIGELWPALELGLENVSGMQFLCVRAGLEVEF